MLEGLWKEIGSGSDIRGVADDSLNGENITLNNDIVEKIALAFVQWLSKKVKLDYSSLAIAVGHDSRNSASRIKNVFINSLRSTGVKVYDCSLASTPAMFMAISVLSCTAAVEITASHQPANRNGFKFFMLNGGLSEIDIKEILEIAQNGNFPSLREKANVRIVNLMDYYCEKLRNLIKDGIKNSENKDAPLKGLKIVVDAGNGVGGFFVKNVLNPLGAITKGSRYLEPDGRFPNHIPNPEEKEAIQSIVEATLQEKADLGIVFDTDVDRAAIVDCSGKTLDKNRLVALASHIALKHEPSSVIVTDSMTSNNLKNFIENLGGTQFRYKRGYSNVISMAKMINLKGENCSLAIETSGHAAFKENDFIDDGAYLACKIIVEAVNLRNEGKTILDDIKNLVDAKEEFSVKIPIKAVKREEIQVIGSEILESFKKYVECAKNLFLEKDNVEGVRVNIKSKQEKGWLILRKSLHDPVIVFYAESYNTGGIKLMMNMLKPFFKKAHNLDLSSIKTYL